MIFTVWHPTPTKCDVATPTGSGERPDSNVTNNEVKVSERNFIIYFLISRRVLGAKEVISGRGIELYGFIKIDGRP